VQSPLPLPVAKDLEVAFVGAVETYFRVAEAKLLSPDSEWEFGYFGKHYILLIPTDKRRMAFYRPRFAVRIIFSMSYQSAPEQS